MGGLGVSAGCPGSPAQHTQSPQGGNGPANGGGSSSGHEGGDYWVNIDDDASFIVCPNPTAPNMGSILQLFAPNGSPIGGPVIVCPQPQGPGNGQASKPLLPPTPSQVWARVALPEPTFGLSPRTAGLTELPTWFWATGVGTPLSVSVSIGGYTVTATADPVAYTWYFGDGTSATSEGTGSASAPAVVHTYHYKGTYTVGLSVEYEGSYTFAGEGGSVSEPLGTYQQAIVTAPYPVQEVRSVLVPSDQESAP